MLILKILGFTFLGVFGLAATFIIYSTVNHKVKLRKESRKFPAPGKLVADLHVYSEGTGDITFVFLSGHGTCAPVIDFKPLWQRLSQDNRILVVERAGYGWSQPTSSQRDIDTILTETRQALELAGETGPFVLIAHSISGLEAVYWTQKYPREVQAIIGLDPTTPEFIEQTRELPTKGQLKFMSLISRIGLSRFMSQTELEGYFPVLKSKDLAIEDKEQFRTLFYRSAYTKNMLDEVDYLEHNAGRVKDVGVPVNTPMYFFISDGKGVNCLNWRELLTDYIGQLSKGKYMYLDSGHYMHNHDSEVIAEEIKAFINLVKGSLEGKIV